MLLLFVSHRNDTVMQRAGSVADHKWVWYVIASIFYTLCANRLIIPKSDFWMKAGYAVSLFAAASTYYHRMDFHRNYVIMEGMISMDGCTVGT